MGHPAKETRPKKKKGKQNGKDRVRVGMWERPPADDVFKVGAEVSTSTLSFTAAEFVLGKARALVATTSRERSPHRIVATTSSSSPCFGSTDVRIGPHWFCQVRCGSGCDLGGSRHARVS